MLHGDLTSGNILLSASSANERGFCAKVADFGLSRTLGSETVDVNTYGTVTHMPPELLTTGGPPPFARPTSPPAPCLKALLCWTS